MAKSVLSTNSVERRPRLLWANAFCLDDLLIVALATRSYASGEDLEQSLKLYSCVQSSYPAEDAVASVADHSDEGLAGQAARVIYQAGGQSLGPR